MSDLFACHAEASAKAGYLLLAVAVVAAASCTDVARFKRLKTVTGFPDNHEDRRSAANHECGNKIVELAGA